jgi:glucose uptake protein GlcU
LRVVLGCSKACNISNSLSLLMTSLKARLAFHKLTKSLWLSVKQKERLHNG